MLKIFADALLIAVRQTPFRRIPDHARWPAAPEHHRKTDRDERQGRTAARDLKW